MTVRLVRAGLMAIALVGGVGVGAWYAPRASAMTFCEDAWCPNLDQCEFAPGTNWNCVVTGSGCWTQHCA